MECYNCGQPVPDGSERCPTCGQRFAVVKKTRTKSRFAGLGCGSLLLLAALLVMSSGMNHCSI